MDATIIFDKDGVLVETEEAKILSYFEVVRELLSADGPTWEEYSYWHRTQLSGQSRSGVIASLLGRFSELHEKLLNRRGWLNTRWESDALLSERYSEVKVTIENELRTGSTITDFPADVVLSILRLIKYADMDEKTRCIPNRSMIDFALLLQETGRHTALITESEWERTRSELSSADIGVDGFRVVVCKDKVYTKLGLSDSRGTKSQMYLDIAGKLPKENSLVAIEDTEVGMRAALEAGIPCFRPFDGVYDEMSVASLRVLHTGEATEVRTLDIGVDFGGTETKVVYGERLGFYVPHTTFAQDSEESIVQFLRKLCGSGLGVRRVGISLACTIVPCVEHTRRGHRRVSDQSSKFASLSQVAGGCLTELEERWSEALGVPVSILNDGEAAVLGEQQRGAARGYDNAVMITLGTSIGIGFVLNGVPQLGSYSSRVSHIVLDPKGEPCPGENHVGCWKMLASRTGLGCLAAEMGLPDDPIELTRRAREGDVTARHCYERFAQHVVAGLETVVAIVPVECVVIGGGISEAGDVLFEPLRKAMSESDVIGRAVATVLPIRKAECKEAVAVGAQLYAERRNLS